MPLEGVHLHRAGVETTGFMQAFSFQVTFGFDAKRLNQRLW
jgi:hypothetical protein